MRMLNIVVTWWCAARCAARSVAWCIALSVTPLAIASAKEAPPQDVAPQQVNPQTGEIRLEGKVLSVAQAQSERAQSERAQGERAQSQLILEVVAFTLPTGKVSRLPQPKPKTILVNAYTALRAQADHRTLRLDEVLAGVQAVAIGKDTGSGQPLTARLLVVALPPSPLSPAPPPAASSPVVRLPVAQEEGRIAFFSMRDGNREIYTVSEDGSNLKRLTDDGGTDSEPSFSPDGSRIVFVSGRDGNSEIYMMNADGSSQVRLTNEPKSDRKPVFTPDGKSILFASWREVDRPAGIYIMNLDGSGATRLGGSHGGQSPSPNHDGSRIAFANGSIFIMDDDGGDVSQLTNRESAYGPAFSADGRKIAFARQNRYDPAHPQVKINSEIYIMNADGLGQTRLTEQEGTDEQPVFSPDSKRIAFLSDRTGNSEIFVMNADGSGLFNLTNSPAHEGNPAWGRAYKGPMPPAIVPAPPPAVVSATPTLPATEGTAAQGGLPQGGLPQAGTGAVSQKPSSLEPANPEKPPKDVPHGPSPIRGTGLIVSHEEGTGGTSAASGTAIAAGTSVVGGTLVVGGTWQPRAAPADANQRTEASPPDYAASWQVARDALRLAIPAKSRAAYEIRRDDPLPEGDWTLDFALIQHDEFVPIEADFFIGEPSSTSFRLHLDPGLDYTEVRAGAGRDYSGGNINSAAGPIQWVRLVRDATAGTLEVWINGVLLPLKDWKASTAVARAPLVFRLYASSAYDKPVTAEVAYFAVRAGTLREPDSVPGLAFAGWPKGEKPQGTTPQDTTPQGTTLQPVPLQWTPALRERLNVQVQKILAAPDTDPNTRANALAIGVLAERAASGALSDANWDKFAATLSKATDLDLEALSRLLPMAIAGGDVMNHATRREKAQTWTRRLFEALPSPYDNRSDVMPILQRAALLDPARTAAATGGRRLSLPFARALATDLREAAPLKAFAAFRTFERAFPNAETWLLPETSALSPLWGALVEKRLREYATQKAFVEGQPDRALAAAAYRLASTQPQAALEFAALIQNPDIKAEALEAVALALPDNAGTNLDGGIESALRAAIAAWKPSARDDSAVPQKVRLAQWQFSRGRKDEARKTLEAAAAQIGKLPPTRFRDTWAVARAARAMNAPGAKLWLDKAAAAAAERDAHADEFGPGLYLSATVLVVGELVKNGQIDDALALVQKLDRGALGDNYDLALARIVFALAKEGPRRDLARAVKLAEDISPGRQRDSVMASLAASFAATDMTKALQIFEQLPEDKRLGAAFTMLGVAPPAQSEKLRALAGQAVAAHLREWKTVKRHDAHQQLLANVSQLSVSALLDLEPSFQDDRAFFTAQLLRALVRDAGWQNTPLWKRYFAADNQNGWSVPWGLGHLRDSIRAEESNRAQDLE
jgi:hypothetical protein